ncbi:MAG: hypothetical protein LBP72_09130 [Dysgonamonadaceae bacterium]|nr:hypothetical protein [Dysgonamonadaceae bacterium]
MYRTTDSLQVVSITELSLTIDEYCKHRQQDLKLIENLKVNRKRLRQIITEPEYTDC